MDVKREKVDMPMGYIVQDNIQSSSEYMPNTDTPKILPRILGVSRHRPSKMVFYNTGRCPGWTMGKSL